MKLNEAISHCKEKELELKGTECGKEHHQLANWLEELKEHRKKIAENIKNSIK